MSYKTKKIKKMIPMYLKGNLPEAETKEVENALKKYPELHEELNDFSEIDQYYQDIENEISPPSGDLYSKIIKNIKTREKEKPIKLQTDYISKFQDILKNIFMSPRVAWACAACALLVMLVSVPLDNFNVKTLTDTKVPENMIQFNILFNEDAREKEIRELINHVNARIINGPAPNGLYVLEVSDQGQKETIKTKLQTSPLVRFAEIRY